VTFCLSAPCTSTLTYTYLLKMDLLAELEYLKETMNVALDQFSLAHLTVLISMSGPACACLEQYVSSIGNRDYYCYAELANVAVISLNKLIG